MESEEKIVLDRKSFGALAVDSRVNILKALRERRKTLTELSDELKLSVSSTKEHLEKLVDAELIVRVEDGHKWKYYELTRKGEKLVSPNQAIRVMVLLGIAAIAFIYSVFLMSMPSPMAGVQKNAEADVGQYATTYAANQSIVPTSAPSGSAEISYSMKELVQIPDVLPIAIAAVSVLIILACAIWLIRRKKQAAY